MKTVFNSATDVIHLFAERSQSEARSSNCFFHGNKLYSYGYHYLMAEYITNKAGEEAIMINDSGYSVTTAKHVRYVISGTRQYKQFLTTKTDAKTVLNELESLLKLLGKARKPEKYLSEAGALLNSFNEFQAWKGTKPENFERDYIKKIRVIEKQFNAGTMKEAAGKIAAFEKRKAAAAKKAAQKEFKENLKKFMNFEIYRINHSAANDEDFLRINPEGHYIETSQGVKINPVSAALLYKLIKAGRDIKGHKIDNYTVISLNGVLTIGCHKINRANMEQTGETLLELGY